MTSILVTGGSGFIGSHTCLLLLEKGYDLVVLDSLINSSKMALDRVSNIYSNKTKSNSIKFINGDIRDNSILDNIFKEAQFSNKNISGVIHFAGLKAVGESVTNPLEYWGVNVNGSINLLKVMDEYKCRTLVFSSSATVYAKGEKNIKLNEESNIKPSNPYGETKLAIERILFNLSQIPSSNWRIANLRYFNPIGAHFSGLIGENPLGLPNNIFPYINQVALKKLDYINIFGNDWDTYDGTGVRDYIHVMDLAEGHISALEYLFNESRTIINFNLGTGIGTSVLELIETFKKVNDVDLPYKFKDRRPGDVDYVVADNSFVKSTLNWEPTRNLDDMCKDGWNWQKKNPMGYK